MVSFTLDAVKFLLIYRYLQNTYWFKREDCCSDLSRGSRQPAMQYYTTVCSRPYAIYIGYIIET